MISSSWTQVPAPPVPPPMPAEGFKAPGVEDFNLPPIFRGIPVLEGAKAKADSELSVLIDKAVAAIKSRG